MVVRQKLAKTSVQLPPDTLRDVDSWPGLTRSEAIRLAVERAHYFATIGSEEVVSIAERFAPILSVALEELDFYDYRIAARALPEIVTGYLRENPNVSLPSDDADGRQLEPRDLIEKLNALDGFGRISILDCVVAQRYRDSKQPVPSRGRTSVAASAHKSRRPR